MCFIYNELLFKLTQVFNASAHEFQSNPVRILVSSSGGLLGGCSDISDFSLLGCAVHWATESNGHLSEAGFRALGQPRASETHRSHLLRLRPPSTPGSTPRLNWRSFSCCPGYALRSVSSPGSAKEAAIAGEMGKRTPPKGFSAVFSAFR
jgi:hypothetical protein